MSLPPCPRDNCTATGQRNGRKFVGCELKPAYFRVAGRNLKAAEAHANLGTLFDDFNSEPA